MKRFLQFLVVVVFVFANQVLQAQCDNCSVRGVNQVVNGSFELGNLGFGSQYTYYSDLYPEGYYYIGRNPKNYHSNFRGQDHTTGSGKFMIVNGAGTPGIKTWCQTIPVLPNTNYSFSTWVASVHPSSPAKLQFSINGVQVGNIFTAPNTTYTWEEFYVDWNSGNNLTATICIENMSTLLSGNDFGIDDIAFTPCLPVNILNPPTAGSDQTVCSGDIVQLGAPLLPGFTYNWVGSALSATNVAQPTVQLFNNTLDPITFEYVLTTDSAGLNCLLPDTIRITVNPLPVFDLGSTLNLCEDNATVTGPNNADSYSWNTGSTQDNILVTQSGDYSLTVTKDGCSFQDLVSVVLDTIPTFNLIDTLNICAGEVDNLAAPFSGVWNTGSTADNLAVNAPGKYWMTKSNGACSYADTVVVNELAYPTFETTPDTFVCNQESVELQSSAICLWEGLTWADKYTVTQPGTYVVEAFNLHCETEKSVTVQFKEILAPLAEDTLFKCEGETINVSSIHSNKNYQWGHGSVQPNADIFYPGKYFLQAFDDFCEITDSVVVIDKPDFVPQLPNDTTLCEGESLTLDVNEPAGYAVLWNNGSNASSRTLTDQGFYVVNVNNGYCAHSESFFLSFQAPTLFSLPSPVHFCEIDSILIEGPVGGALAYTWSNGINQKNNWVKTPGTYSLTVNNGACETTEAMEVVADAMPMMTLAPATNSCEDTPVELTATSTPSAVIAWDNGSNDNTRTVSSPGTYACTVTNGECSTTENAVVTFETKPNPTIPTEVGICAGDTARVDITLPPGYNGGWDGSASHNLATTQGGMHYFYATNGTCVIEDSTEVVITQYPTFSLAPNVTVCETDQAAIGDFSANPSYSYNWSNGVNTATQNVNTPGDYTLTATENGCSTAETTTVALDEMPSLNLPPKMKICEGDQANIATTNIPNYTYTWSNGEHKNEINTATSGTYILTVQNGTCTTSDTTKLSVVQYPERMLPATQTICEIDETTLVAGNNPAYTYAWDNGSTHAEKTTNSEGWHKVVINNDICAITDSSYLQLDEMPSIALPDSVLFCEGQTASFETTIQEPQYVYNWSTGASTPQASTTQSGWNTLVVESGTCTTQDSIFALERPYPVIDMPEALAFCEIAPLEIGTAPESGVNYVWNNGANSAKQTVNSPGTYVLTAENGTCQTVDKITLSMDDEPELNMPELFEVCQGQSAEIVATNNANWTYIWNTGESSNAISKDQSGWYVLNVENGTCKAKDSTEVIVHEQPEIALPADIAICETEVAEIGTTENPNFQYTWNNGITTAMQQVNDEGWYVLTTTHEICVDKDSVFVRVDEIPTYDLIDSVTFCEGEMATIEMLNTKPSYQFAWSNQATQNSITTNQTGWHYVNIFQGVCTANDSVHVSENEFPVFTLPTPLAFCETENIEIGTDNNPSWTFEWSNGVFGSKQTINTPGNYSLTAKNGLCATTHETVVSMDAMPTINLDSLYEICQGESVELSVPLYPNWQYTWNTGSTANNLEVTQTGTYALEIVNGTCAVKDSADVAVYEQPEIALPADVAICETEIAEIGTTDNPSFEYAWSNGVTTPIQQVNTTSWYVLTTTNKICIDKDSVFVRVDEMPVYDLIDSVVFCEGESADIVIENAQLAYQYLWSDNSAQNSINTNQLGWHYVDIYQGVCTANDSVHVAENAYPTFTLPTPVAFCETENIEIGIANNTDWTYEWSNGVFTSTQSINTPGAYALTAKNGTCATTQQMDVTMDAMPTIDLDSVYQICDGNLVELSVPFFPNWQYTWNNGSTANSLTVNAPGNYVLSIVNGTCSVADSAQVEVFEQPNVALPNDLAICQGDDVEIGVDTNSAFTYSWNNGVNTPKQVVNSQGWYVLETSNYICHDRDSIYVRVDSKPNINLPDTVLFCEGDSVEAKVSFVYSWNYEWSNNSATNSIFISDEDAYVLSVYYGVCTSTDTVSGKMVKYPVLNLPDSITACETETVSIESDTENQVDYSWNTGNTGASIQVNQPGTYILSADRLGCVTTANSVLTMDEMPIQTLTDPIACEGDSITLSPVQNSDYQYVWSTGASTPTETVAEAGIYTVFITNGACTQVDSSEVTLLEIPVFELAADTTICEGTSIAIGINGNLQYGYIWNNGKTDMIQEVNTAGTYILTASNVMCNYKDTIVIAVDETPSFTLPQTAYFCTDSSVFVEASTANSNWTWAWSNGINLPRNTFSSMGTYTLTATNNLCTYEESVTVEELSEPIIDLEDMYTVCEDSIFTLRVELLPNETAEWSNGTMGEEARINAAGNHWVTVSNPGCSSTKSFEVIINGKPNTSVPSALTLCEGESTEITVTQDNAAQVVWNTGESGATIQVSQAGLYTYSLTKGACNVMGDVMVNVNKYPVMDIPDSIFFCESRGYVLDATPRFYTDFQWDDGDNNPIRSFTGSETRSYITKNGDCEVTGTVVAVPIEEPGATLPDVVKICRGDSVKLELEPGEYTASWSNGQVGKVFWATESGSVSVLLENGYCTSKAYTQVFAFDYPMLELGDDLNFCEGNEGVIDAQVEPGYTVTWNDGVTANTRVVSEAGIYTATVAREMCVSYDTITVVTDEKPEFNHPESTTVCEGDSITWKLGNNENYKYFWGSEATNSFTAKEAGVYYFTILNNTCAANGEVELALDRMPEVNVGNKGVCENDSVLISLPEQYNTFYVWNSGDTTTERYLSRNGNYRITAINGACRATEKFKVTVHNLPSAEFTMTDTICDNETLKLEAVGGNSNKYYWVHNNDTLKVNKKLNWNVQTGKDLSLDLTLKVRSNKGCESEVTHSVEVISLPEFSLPEAIRECADSLFIVADIDNTQYFSWEDNSQSKSRWIHESGTYTATVSKFMCSASKEVVVLMDTIPSFDLGVDTTICIGTMHTLELPFKVSWNDGQYSDLGVFIDAGEYIATKENGTCVFSDTLNVDTLSVPRIPFTYLEGCEYKGVYVGGVDTSVNITWDRVTPDEDGYIHEMGTFIATTENKCGVNQQEVEIYLMPCDYSLYVPSSFTPNGDGDNDVFFPVYSGLDEIELVIYDRWGKEMFRGMNKDAVWDGTHNGEKLRPDVYPIKIIASYIDKRNGNVGKFVEDGRVTIVR